jgi:hypothetical protein
MVERKRGPAQGVAPVDRIGALCDELIERHGSWLPEYRQDGSRLIPALRASRPRR